MSLDFWGVREPWQDDMADDPTTFTDALWQRLLDAEGVPALRDLTFSSTGFGDQLVDALIGSRLLRSLDKLAIDDTELTELGYQRMRDNIDAFQHLDLKLSTSTTYPEARAQVIEAYWASQARRTY